MADYQQMYYILCRAVDRVIDPLERIPLARPAAQTLRAALLAAEEVYLCAEDTPLTLLPTPPADS